MKTSLKANLLKHFIAKKDNGGFTLIELLVVIIIIGILSAIALPSFLNQANRARQSEAQTYVGSMNRAQQAFYLENVSFTEEISELGLGIAADTQNYIYRAQEIGTEDIQQAVQNVAIPSDGEDDPDFSESSPLLAFVGAVGLGTTTGEATGEQTTVAVLCRSNNTPAQGLTAAQIVAASGDTNEGHECAANFTPIN